MPRTPNASGPFISAHAPVIARSVPVRQSPDGRLEATTVARPATPRLVETCSNNSLTTERRSSTTPRRSADSSRTAPSNASTVRSSKSIFRSTVRRHRTRGSRRCRRNSTAVLRPTTPVGPTVAAGWRAGRPTRSSRSGSRGSHAPGNHQPRRRSRQQRRADLGEAGCQANTVLVHSDYHSTSSPNAAYG